MPAPEPPIQVEKTTLGGALRNGPLAIPDYQREYSWTAKRVRKLFDDFNLAMIRQQASYFLGTMVTTAGEPPRVVDGQQRLATTSIFLAAVRDRLIDLKKFDDAEAVDGQFLWMWDMDKNEHVPRLRLNCDDRSYYCRRVLTKPDERQNESGDRLTSHRKIDEAADISAQRVESICQSADTVSRKVEALKAWVKFIDKRALLVVLTPPNSARAFQMFKTLNDRAQRTTQGDMIKSHLFEVADQPDEAQAKWSSMRSLIEGVETKKTDDPLLTYLHHLSIVHYGPIKADDIFEEMEDKITSQSKALGFLESLAIYANDYAAILSDSHAKWGDYDRRVRDAIGCVSGELKVVFMRPLMLAVARHFDPKEAYPALESIAAWVVRLLIAGGHRSGTVEKVSCLSRNWSFPSRALA